MSVLDTLYLLFKSDSKDVKKGAEDAKKASDGLEKSLLSNKQAADQLGKSFLGSVQNAQKNITRLLTLSALTAQTLKQSAQAEELGQFSERLNQNVEDITLWGKLVEHTGGTAEGFRGTIEGLTNTLTEFSISGGGPAAEVFAKLGITAYDAQGQLKSAFDIIEEFGDAINELGLTNEQAAKYGQALGIDNATILLLQRGRGEIEKLTERHRRLGLITEEDTRIATGFNKAWRDTKTLFSSIARDIGFFFLPVITEAQILMQDFILFFRDSEEYGKQFFAAVAFVGGTTLLPVLKKIGLIVGGLLLPFAKISAVVSVAFLAINDLFNYLQGNDSILGRFISTMDDLFDRFNKWDREVTNRLKDTIEDATGTVRSWLGLGPDPEEEAANERRRDNIERHRKGFGFGDQVPDSLIEQTYLDQLKNHPDYKLDIPILDEDIYKSFQNTGFTAINPAALTNQSNQVNNKTLVSIQNMNIDARGGDSTEISQNVGGQLENYLELANANYSTTIVG